MTKSIIFSLGLIFILASCSEEGVDIEKKPKEKEPKEIVDLRDSLNGYWLLISQSFTKGRKLEKFPVGGSVSMILTKDNGWFTLFKDDTVSVGHFSFEGNEITLVVDKSLDETSCTQVHGVVKLKGRFLQIEGNMSYDDQGNDYMHALFGRSERSVDEVLVD